MSEKRAKALRKLKKQSMENKQKAPEYSFQQLQNLIALLHMLTGEKPKELTLTESFYTWYMQECQNEADILGLNLGFRNDPVEFSGVKLFKKGAKIEIAK